MAFLDRFKKQRPGAKEKVAARPPKKETASSSSSASVSVSKDDTKEAYRILQSPIMSEKASRNVSDRQYTFVVPLSATRIGVARAVTALYGTRPENVNIIRVKGKRVRFGGRAGKQKDWKKAIVTLKAGQTIPVFEGV